MSIVAQLKRIEETGLRDVNADRPLLVDGSLSEIVSQALNVAYSKKDYYTQTPFYGEENPEGGLGLGGGNVANPLTPDSPMGEAVVLKPSLEDGNIPPMVKMIAQELGNQVYRKDDPNIVNIQSKPAVVYAVPDIDEMPQDMTEDIDARIEIAPSSASDIIIVHTGEDSLGKPYDSGTTAVLMGEEKLKDYEDKGVKVYRSLESFVSDLPHLRQRV